MAVVVADGRMCGLVTLRSPGCYDSAPSMEGSPNKAAALLAHPWRVHAPISCRSGPCAALAFAAPAQAQNIPIAPIPEPGSIQPGEPVLSDTTPFSLVIPVVGSRALNTVKPGDATLVLRLTATITNAWYDACAPYDEKADGLVFQTDRRPAAERTTRNCDIALVYSSLPVVESLLPQWSEDWAGMVDALDVDLDDPVQRTAADIGLAAGEAVMQARLGDGMNQLGDEDGTIYNRLPYADYTEYRPRNTAYRLRQPRHWQPAFVTNGNGLFSIQQFVTPQMEFTRPFLTAHPHLKAPPPWKSYAVTPAGVPRRQYVAQAREVLDVSARLTEQQKMVAEVFEDKINSLGLSIAVASFQQGLTLQEFLQVDFLVNAAAFDTAIVIWKEKRRYDAVRPFSAIRYIYGHRRLTAWGGPGQGTVNDITGNEWRSYLNVANHPEYPSATASFCAAHATASKLYLAARNSASNPDGNTLGWQVSRAAGSSFVEPGVTPANDLTLTFETWDQLREECGLSRLWGGVHFFDSIPAGQDIGDVVGEAATTSSSPTSTAPRCRSAQSVTRTVLERNGGSGAQLVGDGAGCRLCGGRDSPEGVSAGNVDALPRP